MRYLLTDCHVLYSYIGNLEAPSCPSSMQNSSVNPIQYIPSPSARKRNRYFPKIFPLLSGWAEGDQSLYSAACVNELDCRGLK